MSCNSTEVTLAELFKEDRLERGLTQAEAAAELGITRMHYCKLENGKATNPRMNIFGPLFRRKARLISIPCCNPEPHRHIAEPEPRPLAGADKEKL